MTIEELLNKGFSAKFIEENFSMLTGATPKEKPKEPQKPKEEPQKPKEEPQKPKEESKETTFTESEVKEIIKKYASMENKKVEKEESKPLSKEEVINNILGISVATTETSQEDLDTNFNKFMNSLLGYEESEEE